MCSTRGLQRSYKFVGCKWYRRYIGITLATRPCLLYFRHHYEYYRHIVTTIKPTCYLISLKRNRHGATTFVFTDSVVVKYFFNYFFSAAPAISVSLLLYKRRVWLNIFWKKHFSIPTKILKYKTLERPKLTRVIKKKKRSDSSAVRLQTTLAQNVMTVFFFSNKLLPKSPTAALSTDDNRYARPSIPVTVLGVCSGRKNDGGRDAAAAARNVFRGRKSIRFPSVEQCAKTRSAKGNIPRRQYREITIFAVYYAHMCV